MLCFFVEKDNWYEGDFLVIILLDKDENLLFLFVVFDKNYIVIVLD